MRSKKAIFNILTNLMLQVVIIIYGFVVPKIIIKNYGSNVNGLISSITQFLGYISLIEAGFGGVIQFLLYKPIAEKNKNQINDILAATQKFFNKVSIIFLIYIAILLIIYPLIINDEFDNLYTISLIIIISISTFFEYYIGLVYRIYLLADQKNYVISNISIVCYALNIIALVILSKINVSIQLFKLISALIFTIRPIFQMIYVKKKYRIDINNGNPNYKISQKWDALAQHIASVIHNSTDITILTLFSSLTEVSVYSVYSIVVLGVRKIISTFYDALKSTFGDLLARKEYNKMKTKFEMTETIYLNIIVILFSCTIILIVPFVKLYTLRFLDANYVRPLFAVLFAISELIWAIRLPYSSLTLAAGYYKETKKGAIIECMTNIIISLMFVKRYGIIGVAIGTLVAMLIRTIEFVVFSSKKILNRKLLSFAKKVILVTTEILIIVYIGNNILIVDYSNYFNWLKNAIIVFSISTIISIPMTCIFYYKDYVEIINIFKRLVKRR